MAHLLIHLKFSLLLVVTSLFLGCSLEPSTSSDAGVELSEASGPIIRGTGHGAFFTTTGEQIELTRDIVLRTQKHLIQKWWAQLEIPSSPISEFHRREKEEDPLFTHHRILDQLLDLADERKVPGTANDRQLNNNFYSFYLRVSGVQSTVVRQPLTTQNSGEDYIEECRDNGVPVPDLILDENWINHGVLKTNFISEFDAELWSWVSSDVDGNPLGICVALPRWEQIDVETKQSDAFGVICLGYKTSKVCYFDNYFQSMQKEKFRNTDLPIATSRLIGGAELVPNEGGICSDCHAGGNPFVIHPADPAFAALLATPGYKKPSRWPDPIVADTWPQNPGPIFLPPPTQGGGDCGTCHNDDDEAIQFPLISNALNGYCYDILDGVFGSTMPDGAPSQAATYQASFDTLKAMCENPPVLENTNGGVIVENPPPDDPSFLSPPIVDWPIYACASEVGVMSARLNATITVFVNGAPVVEQDVEDSYFTQISVPPLKEHDVVTAIQTLKNGSSSDLSSRVRVRDYLVDYPAGLPIPQIDPTIIHECGHKIAVRKIKGSAVTVYTNGSPQSGSPSAYEHLASWGNGPFQIDDELRASQQLCDDSSDISQRGEFVIAAPGALGPVYTNPEAPYEGQELLDIRGIVESARLEIDEKNLGNIYTYVSWPTRRIARFNYAKRAGRPVQSNDVIAMRQSLCTTESKTATLLPAKSCAEIKAPEVMPAVEGENFIKMMEFIPGATIRVNDGTPEEIGDGAGRLILLARPLQAWELITISQDLGVECGGHVGVQITVLPGNGQPIGDIE